VHTVCN